MKNAKSIVSHTLKPFEPKLNKMKCQRKIFDMLPKSVNNWINYFYIRDDILYVAVYSQAFKADLVHKKDMLIEFANMLRTHDTNCIDLTFSYVNVFVSREKREVEKQQVVVYEERADGEFENLAKNEKIHQVLEEIRQVIKETV
ncbi:MAG: hypothetical protein OIF32_05285 [Campylobacterales bacterium]|nr:hypothetical protein [Campylobacterales bacterium]